MRNYVFTIYISEVAKKEIFQIKSYYQKEYPYMEDGRIFRNVNLVRKIW